jgi:phosphoglycolate phosphatase
MTSVQKFIVWDWNGTLQDDFEASVACANMNLQNVGRPPVDKDTYRECFDVPIDRFYRNLGLTEDEIVRCLDPMQELYFSSYDKMVANVDFRHGGREILDYAKQQGIMNLILSNHLIEAIAKDLHRLKKRDAFHEILAWPSRDAQFKEPKGNLLTRFMSHLDLRPENGIIVGDTPEEVKVARELGLVSVALSGGYNSVALLEKAKPDHIIHSLLDLKPILRQRKFAA